MDTKEIMQELVRVGCDQEVVNEIILLFGRLSAARVENQQLRNKVAQLSQLAGVPVVTLPQVKLVNPTQ